MPWKRTTRLAWFSSMYGGFGDRDMCAGVQHVAQVNRSRLAVGAPNTMCHLEVSPAQSPYGQADAHA
jgi:hypothetical protein